MVPGPTFCTEEGTCPPGSDSHYHFYMYGGAARTFDTSVVGGIVTTTFNDVWLLDAVHRNRCGTNDDCGSFFWAPIAPAGASLPSRYHHCAVSLSSSTFLSTGGLGEEEHLPGVSSVAYEITVVKPAGELPKYLLSNVTLEGAEPRFLHACAVVNFTSTSSSGGTETTEALMVVGGEDSRHRAVSTVTQLWDLASFRSIYSDGITDKDNPDGLLGTHLVPVGRLGAVTHMRTLSGLVNGHFNGRKFIGSAFTQQQFVFSLEVPVEIPMGTKASRWSSRTLPPTPTPLTLHTASTVGISMIIYGGLLGTVSVGTSPFIQVLRSDRLEWQSYGALGAGAPNPRSGHTAVVFDTSIVVFGGMVNGGTSLGDADTYLLDASPDSTPYLSFYKLNTTGPGPTARQGHCAWRIDDTMYVYGGTTSPLSVVLRDVTDPDPVFFDDLYALDLSCLKISNCFAGDSAPRWRNLTASSAPLPPPRAFHTCTPVGSTMLLFGGGAKSRTDYNTTYMFDTFRETLFEVIQPAGYHVVQPHVGHGAVGTDLQVFVVGGMSWSLDALWSQIWVFDIPTMRWAFTTAPSTGEDRTAAVAASKFASKKIQSLRQWFSAVLIGSHLVIYGGRINDAYASDTVYCYRIPNVVRGTAYKTVQRAALNANVGDTVAMPSYRGNQNDVTIGFDVGFADNYGVMMCSSDYAWYFNMLSHEPPGWGPRTANVKCAAGSRAFSVSASQGIRYGISFYGVYIQDCALSAPTAPSWACSDSSRFDAALGCDGGAIHVSSSVMLFAASTIAQTSAPRHGGAIAIVSGVAICDYGIISNTSASGSGGAIFAISLPQTQPQMSPSYFYSAVLLSFTRVANGMASDAGGLVFAGDYSSVQLDGSLLELGVAKRGSGGGICCEGCLSVILRNSNVTDSCTHANGGAIAARKLQELYLLASYLQRNTALGGFGGGVHVEDFNASATVLASSIFHGNTAPLGGGGAYHWNGSAWPPTTFNNDFDGNRAFWSNDYASGPFHLVPHDQTDTSVSPHVSGKPISPPLLVYIEDFYGHVVRTINHSSIFASSKDPLLGTIVAPVFGGVAAFNDLAVLKTPGQASSIAFDASLISGHVGGKQDGANITVHVRVCQAGEQLYLDGRACRACKPGTYSLQVNTRTCWVCPFGGNCSQGGSDVVATPGFWGLEANTTGVDSYTALFFTRCPPGYCCSDDVDRCPSYNFCAGNRAGRLCGSCKPGYSQNLGSPTCRPDEDCNDGLLGSVGAIVGIFGFAGYLVLAPKSKHPNAMGRIVAFFFQVVGLLIAPTSQSLLSLWQRSITRIFDLQLPVLSQPTDTTNKTLADNGHHGFCPIPGLSTVGEVALQFVGPLFVLAALGLLYIGHRHRRAKQLALYNEALARVQMVDAREDGGRRPSTAHAVAIPVRRTRRPTLHVAVGYSDSEDSDDDEHGPLMVVTSPKLAPVPAEFPHRPSFERDPSHGDIALVPRRTSPARRSRGDSVFSDETLNSPQHLDESVKLVLSDVARPKPISVDYAIALTTLVLMAYSTAVKSTLALLDCVTVHGLDDRKFLFVDANIECYQPWQWALIAFAAFLVSCPVILYFIGEAKRDERTTKAWIAVLRTLNAPYSRKCRWWKVVIITRRLLLVVMASMMKDTPVARNVSMALVVLVSLCIQMYVQPFRDPAVNLVEGLLLASLVVVAMLELPSAAFRTAHAPITGQVAQDVTIASYLELALTAIPAIFIVYYMGKQEWDRREQRREQLKKAKEWLDAHKDLGLSRFDLLSMDLFDPSTWVAKRLKSKSTSTTGAAEEKEANGTGRGGLEAPLLSTTASGRQHLLDREDDDFMLG